MGQKWRKISAFFFFSFQVDFFCQFLYNFSFCSPLLAFSLCMSKAHNMLSDFIPPSVFTVECLLLHFISWLEFTKRKVENEEEEEEEEKLNSTWQWKVSVLAIDSAHFPKQQHWKTEFKTIKTRQIDKSCSLGEGEKCLECSAILLTR